MKTLTLEASRPEVLPFPHLQNGDKSSLQSQAGTEAAPQGSPFPSEAGTLIGSHREPRGLSGLPLSLSLTVPGKHLCALRPGSHNASAPPPRRPPLPRLTLLVLQKLLEGSAHTVSYFTF